MSDPIFTYCEVMGNRDQTEGKGGREIKRAFPDEETAVRWADSREGHDQCGVMGRGPGEVVRVNIRAGGPALDGQIFIVHTKVWGYRKAPWKSAWDYGYIDLRDSPDNDPDFATYMRLKQIYDPGK